MTTTQAATNAAAKLTPKQVEALAREKWNALADENNQWDELGQDEKYAQIEQVRAVESALLASLAPAGLETLTRYEFWHEHYSAGMSKEGTGDYVLFADVERWAASHAAAIHYPACWDTAAYPTLADALSAVHDHFKCSECQGASHAGAAAEPAEIITDGPAGWRHGLNPPAAAPSSADVRAAEAKDAATIYQEALVHAAFYVRDHCQHGEEHAQIICDLKIPERYTAMPAAPATDVRAAGWLPIETAPKDGTEVLLYLQEPFNRVVKARWFDLWENWIDGEFLDANDEYCGIGSRVPTHWMPLPAAPAIGQSEGGAS